MSHTRTQRHTKLAQYVIQPKNTVRSRHFAPRMRVSKGIKDSKASFARRAQNGQPRSSFPLLPHLPAILLLYNYPPPAPPRLSPSDYLCIYAFLPLSHPRRRASKELTAALSRRAIRGGRVACTRPHSKRTEIRANRRTMREARVNARRCGAARRGVRFHSAERARQPDAGEGIRVNARRTKG